MVLFGVESITQREKEALLSHSHSVALFVVAQATIWLLHSTMHRSACRGFRDFEPSSLSALHPSFTLLLRYRFQVDIKP